jgi:hypothetical protein
MSDLSNDTKKHNTKSRETIPLNYHIFVFNTICNAYWTGIRGLKLPTKESDTVVKRHNIYASHILYREKIYGYCTRDLMLFE